MTEMIERKPHHVVWDKQKISEFWDTFGNITPVSPWFASKASGFILKELKKLKKDYFPHKKNIKILDFGSGSGELLNSISKLQGFECYGVDLSPERVKIAQENFPHIRFSTGSLTESGHKDNYFDIVISTQTIEHLMDDELNKAFTEMSRVLSSKGLAFYTTRYKEDLTKRLKVCPDCLCIFLHSQHLQSFSPESIAECLSKANMKPIINKRSRCRDHLNDMLPKKVRFLSKILHPLFGKYLDQKIGKYLYTVGMKN